MSINYCLKSYTSILSLAVCLSIVLQLEYYTLTFQLPTDPRTKVVVVQMIVESLHHCTCGFISTSSNLCCLSDSSFWLLQSMMPYQPKLDVQTMLELISQPQRDDGFQIPNESIAMNVLQY